MVLRFLSNETWTFGTMGYCFVTCIFVFRILQGWNIKNTNIQVKKQYCLVSKGSSFSYDNPANICWSPKCLQDMSSRRLAKLSSRRLGRRNIAKRKTYSLRFQNMSWRRLQDISSRRLQDMPKGALKLDTNKMFNGKKFTSTPNKSTSI